MAEPLALGIDSGTSGCKALAIAPGTGAVARGFAPHETLYPRPGWAEQDAAGWWLAAAAAVREMDADVRRRVRVLAVASQREGLLPVDGAGKPLGNCQIWLDRRAEPAMAEVLRVMPDEDLFAITGLRADPTFSLARIVWMRTAMPELLRAERLLQPADFLVHRLTGQFTTDVSLASRTSLLDVRARRWSEEIARSFNVDLSLMPDLAEPGDAIGTIRAAAAEELGLPKDVLVVAGAGDQQAMALGAGASRPGVIAASLGTSTSLVTIIREPLLDPGRRVVTNCAGLPGAWDLQAPTWTTGGAFEWLAQLGGGATTRGVAPLLDLAIEAEPGARGVLVVPHMAGEGAPRWRPAARGGILNLGAGHQLADVARATLEGIAFELRANLEVLCELTGPVRVLVVGGGLMRHRLMPRLLASMLGVPILPEPSDSAAARGVALLGAVTAGLAGGLEEITPDPHGDPDTIQPDRALGDVYADIFARRRQLIGDAADCLR